MNEKLLVRERDKANQQLEQGFYIPVYSQNNPLPVPLPLPLPLPEKPIDKNSYILLKQFFLAKNGHGHGQG